MIGLGSNRLTCCRRGGMSVTQAGRGGMEWLGVRGVSPYSAAATAALKDAFPTQWPTIRDYGFAHPEIVGYMNAYAPEDAKIAYSLVEGIGTRWLCNDKVAYIDTGFHLVYGDNISIEWMQYSMTSLTSEDKGYGTGSSLSYNITGGGRNNPITPYIYNTHRSLSPSVSKRVGLACRDEITIGANTTFKMIELDTLTEHSITPVSTPNGASFDSGNNLYLFKDNSASYPFNGYKGMGRVIKGGTSSHDLVPFKLGVARSADQVYPSSKGAQAVGTLGMLDLVTGLFHPNAASSGSFTISETPAS